MTDAGITEIGLVKEKDYEKTMNSLVLPWLRSREQVIHPETEPGKQLYVCRLDAEKPRGTVVLVHGFTENAEKFSELAFSLLQNGWSVVAYDQRGHGRSWRDPRAKKDPSLVHVDHFEEYVSDLETICSQVAGKMPGPRMVFSHSMGGAVTALYMEKHPETFARAVFCAPMIACSRNGTPEAMARAMCMTAKLLGLGTRRIPMSRPYSQKEAFETSCASGKERFEWYEDLRIKTPEFQDNGPSFSWTLEAFNVTKKILAPGEVEKISVPVRVYGAENDTTVIGEDQQAFADRLKNGTRKVIAGAKHEIYRSPDRVLYPWWNEILTFFGEE